MINSFISLVARDILQNNGSRMKDLALVFPNRRSGMLFRQALIGQIDSPIWSPGIFSIDDWLIGISGLKKADNLVELALLFDVVKEHFPQIEVFADFMDLGETLLADFDDTDKYLADPDQLFLALNQIKKIDNQFDVTEDEDLASRIRVFWSSFGSGLSSHQEKWLELWEKLLAIYRGFHESMQSKGLGTSGMCYRKAASGLVDGKIAIGQYEKVAFIGFNILTASEETVFNFLKDQGKALFYWDYHNYYLTPPHEAGKFMQEYLEKFPAPEGFSPFPEGTTAFFNISGPEKTVNVLPVTSNTGQIQALLKDLKSRPNIMRGIILSDESLFSDLISSWPGEAQPVNFTSGYPLKDTQAAGFFNSLVSVYLDLNQTFGKQFCKTSIVTDMLQHPWSAMLLGYQVETFIQVILRRFPDSVPASFLMEEVNLYQFLGTSNTAVDFLNRLIETGNRLLVFDSGFYPIEKVAINALIAQAGSFATVLAAYDLKMDARSLSKLISRFVSHAKLPIETARGAWNQVTGILETRLVDFDEVFILSFNEGMWPSKSLPGSLIPYSLRKVFHLPTAENRDAMYAYYFYRLIQRTNTLTVYYLTGHMDDVIRSGEKSRYLTQLQFELPEKVFIRLEPPVHAGFLPPAITIAKVGEVQNRLKLYLQNTSDAKSLSPSAINEYIDCSLKFALKRIYDFKEPDEIAFASEPKGFGILIHQVMNRLYMNLVGTDSGPDKDWLVELIGNKNSLDGIIREEYAVVLNQPGVVKPGGKELLAMEVVSQFVKKILEFDNESRLLKFLGLEQKFSVEYAIQIDGVVKLVNLNGIIDRVDAYEGGIRIIDYKTGNCELNVKSISDLFDPTLSKRAKEVFQVLTYCEFLMHQNSIAKELVPCLFRMGRFRAGNSDHRVRVDGKEIVFSDVRNDFNQGLRGILEELFNPQLPFVQTTDVNRCRYCPFTGICSR